MASNTGNVPTASATDTLSSAVASLTSGAVSASGSLLSTSGSFLLTPSATSSSSSSTQLLQPTTTGSRFDAQKNQGIGIVSFLTALAAALIIFAVQILLFLVLRNKLARIFKPKTYLVPERERTDPPPRGLLGMFKTLMKFSDREIINKCGLDAYFFLRYLKTLLVIFIPVCAVVMPILIPINFVGGRGHRLDFKQDEVGSRNASTVTGLDTLAWGNVSPKNTSRYGAHLLLAILVIIWVCTVFFFELRVYIKVRQDWLTSAEHRLRASATTVLVNSIPTKWLSEEALQGLFDVFPGGVRNIWLNRDLSRLLDKISDRDRVHLMLEQAETDLIKMAKKAQLKQRAAEERKRRKEMNLRALSKQERAERNAQEDLDALKRANSAGGLQSGDKHQIPHTLHDGIIEGEQDVEINQEHEQHERGFGSKGLRIPLFGDPLAKVGNGIRGAVHKAGNEMDETLETTNGFGLIDRQDHPPPPSRGSNRPGMRLSLDADAMARPSVSDTLKPLNGGGHYRSASALSGDSSRQMRLGTSRDTTGPVGNTVRKLENEDDMYSKEVTKWWQFWKPPSGGYASPVPQGAEAEAYLQGRTTETLPLVTRIKHAIPFMGPKDPEYEYAEAINPDYNEEKEEPAEWEKYLKAKQRPTHHLPLFGVGWMFGLPFITKKVDTIYWCRKELARLNVEIEEDQQHPERFPLMNSAFVQFNHQVAAHMACQSVIHHVPKQMAPRMNEISPRDVLWENMAVSWWQEWLRTAIVTAVIGTMIFLWALPVAWTAALSQLGALIEQVSWLGWINDNSTVENIAKGIAGVLPAIVLGLLLFLIPLILDFLAGLKGAKTGSQKIEFVQVFYFIFLFVQVFLIVSITSFFTSSLDRLVANVQKLQTVSDVLDLLAVNLPKAANYFFSYMILQALSTSSGTLLQIGALVMWYVIARIFDSTARNKWSRNTNLNQVRWGAFFPVYTNFACIGLVYCVVAPLISVFAVITFSLLWIAQRYAMLYVTRFEQDTGGVLYPRAINQTFTGLYVMELCMAGLFFIVEDEKGRNTCTTHGIIMLIVLILTVIYQFLLNLAFSPLFRYLPITFEDEAVLRDEAFQRAQDRRFGITEGDTDEESGANGEEKQGEEKKDIELRRLGSTRSHNPINRVGTWAKDGGNQLRRLAGKPKDTRGAEYRRQQRRKDLEAQRAIGDALYGGIHDEIEDLTPDERDALTRHAFFHSALRARRPTVWIPRDDLGVSDDEIRRTQDYSNNIWISNEGTALDSKVRVVYGKAPPDFSEIDLINL